jgi:hypothetical protein
MPATPARACGAGMGSFAKENITPTIAPVERERSISRIRERFNVFNVFNPFY